ncbi:heavy-metal-associated domain-containing protein [Brenneria populi subsp. brevivirga]|uniref:heavy-metal-associated domain-containing protein n=1 Tax=Brenneria populi TaxID=1505588 RepID=UPI002E18AA9B|nr:heavy-metal-associated domain-containing protein [Brenneria populi subsp. brevivirga]
MSYATINVQGMACGGCAGKVKNALEALNGVQSVDVTLETGLVNVEYDETEKANPGVFRDTVEGLGFDVVPQV